jgi:hypothetical protein
VTGSPAGEEVSITYSITAAANRKGELPPMGKKLDGYADNFPRRARECKQKAGGHCECCGVKEGTPRPIKRGRWKGIEFPVFLNAAHVFGDKMNPDAELMALCPECHGTYDNGKPAERQRILEAVKATRKKRGETVPW